MTEYKNPPIIESILTLELPKPLSVPHIEKRINGFVKPRSEIEALYTISGEVNEDKVSSRTFRSGYKVIDDTGLNLILIEKDSISAVRRAPYRNWEDLAASLQNAIEYWSPSETLGSKIRINSTVFNVINIPVSSPIRIEDYLNFSVQTPNTNDKVHFYNARVVMPGLPDESNKDEFNASYLIEAETGIIPQIIPHHCSVELLSLIHI